MVVPGIYEPAFLTMEVIDIIQDCVDGASQKLLPYLQSIDNKITGIHFLFGPPEDVVAMLETKARTPEGRLTKYPLVALFLDIEEVSGERSDVQCSVTLDLVICTNADPKHTPPQRKQGSFGPILHPIRNELLQQFAMHPAIEQSNAGLIKHNKVDRYYWGKRGLQYYKDGQKNVFSDFIDATEMLNTELTIFYYEKICN